MIEIERKFLVDKSKLPPLTDGYYIKQGYIFDTETGILRIRQRADKFYLTVKSRNIGISRLEVEIEISKLEGEKLFEMVNEDKIISKIRYDLQFAGKIWELDVFLNPKDLVLAEIELHSVDEPFQKPDWVLEDVSINPKYYNSNLL